MTVVKRRSQVCRCMSCTYAVSIRCSLYVVHTQPDCLTDIHWIHSFIAHCTATTNVRYHCPSTQCTTTVLSLCRTLQSHNTAGTAPVYTTRCLSVHLSVHRLSLLCMYGIPALVCAGWVGGRMHGGTTHWT